MQAPIALTTDKNGKPITAKRVREMILKELDRKRPREKKLAELNQLLLVVQSRDGTYFRPLATRVRTAMRRIRELILSDEYTEARMRRLIESVGDDLRSTFTQQLNRVATDQIVHAKSEMKRRLSDSQLEQVTGLPVSNGRLRPQSGMVPNITDLSLDFVDILLLISPLLMIRGDRSADEENSIDDQLLDIDPESIVEQHDPTVSAQYRKKLDKIIDARDIAALIDDELKENGEKSAIKLAEAEIVGDDRKAGMLGLLRQELRHEALRIGGDIREEGIKQVDGKVCVGYILYSRFLPTTGDEHAANDGLRFYRDNREEADRPWSQRLIPPYRKNCVCFTQPIYEDPLGESYGEFSSTSQAISGARKIKSSDIGGRIWDQDRGGYVTITAEDVGTTIKGRQDWGMIEPRDVGSFGNWFDQQFPGIQQKLMGEPRWRAVKSKVGDRKPRYSDFIDIRGRFLSVRVIERESEVQRILRTRSVHTQIKTRQRLYREGFEEGGSKFRVRPNDEAGYRRRLERFASLLQR